MLIYILVHEDYGFYPMLLGIISTLLLAVVTVCLFYRSWLLYWIFSRKYSFNDNGIILRYCNNKYYAISWKEVADICVCDVNHNYGGGFDIVVRVGLQSEKGGPLCAHKMYAINGYDKWRQEEYFYRNYKNIIYFDFSEKRLSQMVEICGQEVIDRRTKRGKAFYICSWDGDV